MYGIPYSYKSRINFKGVGYGCNGIRNDFSFSITSHEPVVLDDGTLNILRCINSNYRVIIDISDVSFITLEEDSLSEYSDSEINFLFYVLSIVNITNIGNMAPPRNFIKATQKEDVMAIWHSSFVYGVMEHLLNKGY